MFRLFGAALLLAGVFMSTAQSLAQSSIPSRPITLVVPSAAGGAADVLARYLAEGMSEILGRPVVVENRGGAAGSIAALHVGKSDPTGDTILLLTSQTQARRTGVRLDPIGMIAKSPFVLVTGGQVKFISARELVAGAKLGTVTFALTGVGDAAALSKLRIAGDARFAIVRQTTSVLALQDLAGSRVDAAFLTPATALDQVNKGALRPLAVTSRERIPQMPDVPTLVEAGLEGAVFEQWVGLVAPAMTPREAVAILNNAMLKTLERPDFKLRLYNLSYRGAPSSPEGFGAAVNAAGGVPICGPPCPADCSSGCDGDCCVIRY